MSKRVEMSLGGLWGSKSSNGVYRVLEFKIKKVEQDLKGLWGQRVLKGIMGSPGS